MIPEKKDDLDGFIGSSVDIQRIRETVVKYSLEEELVLLVGETGVGKSHIARLIHICSGRKGQLVVADITSISNLNKKSIVKTGDKAAEIWKRIKTGENFWDWVWKPFMGRDIDRDVVKQILKKKFRKQGEGPREFKLSSLGLRGKCPINKTDI